MAQLFTDYSVVSHSLREFTDRAYHLHEVLNDNDGFLRFVLTGEFVDEDGEPKQAFVDPIQNNVIQDGHELSILRDYDSLLGVADKIMVDASISVFIVPHNTYALKTGIHLKHPIRYQRVSFSC